MNSPLPFVKSVCLTILLTLHLPTVFGAEPQVVNPPERTAIAIESLSRLKGIDLETNPAMKNAVSKVLDQVRGTPQFVELAHRSLQIAGIPQFHCQPVAGKTVRGIVLDHALLLSETYM